MRREDTVTGDVALGTGCDRQGAVPAAQARWRTVAATPYSGAAGGGGRAQAGAKRSLSPSRRSTDRNHKVDAPVPATTSAAVATVDSIRNRLAGSVTISTARPAVSSRKIPAHNQVAAWKKRCRPG